MNLTGRWKLLLLVLVAGLPIVAVVDTVAAKKPAPPPEPTDGGIIYHYWPETWSSVLPDGTGNAVEATDIPSNSPPSEFTHDGERWYLTIGRIVGDEYPDQRYRFDVFAVSDSGARVRLTNAPNVQPTYAGQGVPGLEEFDQSRVSLTWSHGDRRISYVAREWSEDEIVRGGIFYAYLPADFTQMTPVVPKCVAVPMVDHVVYGKHVRIYNQGLAWSPDGTRVAYSTDGGLNLVTVATGASVHLTDSKQRIQRVRWSPGGTHILFDDSDGISTIKPDGSSRTLVVTPDDKGFPDQADFSPTGSHIVFRYRKSHPNPAKVTRHLKVATWEGDDVRTILENSGLAPRWVSE